MKAPLISKRISFRWITDPPKEQTSTVVLTSPGGYFVDIRVFIDAQEPKLQWAFAGTAAHEVVNGKSTGRWVHEVDSKHPGGFQDSGTFTDLPNGDALEEGMMLDDSSSPAVERAYEEVWNDKDAGVGEFYCVLKLEEGEADRKVIGYYFILGNIAQGVVKNAEGELGVARWTREDSKDLWRVEHSFGELYNWFPEPTRLTLEPYGKFENPLLVKGHNWRCIEQGGV